MNFLPKMIYAFDFDDPSRQYQPQVVA